MTANLGPPAATDCWLRNLVARSTTIHAITPPTTASATATSQSTTNV